MTFFVSEQAMVRFLHGPGGAFFDKVALEVRQLAIRKSGFDHLTHDYERFPHHLVERIDFRREQGPAWVVFADQAYALAHHEGTRAHVIFARRKRALAFQVGGRWVVVRVVHHPGTRPNPYLREALEHVAARRLRAA
ncbi:MAG: hypothetical protein KatS3mg014_2544 [Actinomycetota bacterium]|nr:MAG: hypothetical protein KatS3mg014_2461 [Actinomycetota bacterium]GIV00929.1 MAG: hypothetical protein KatS3mg014_2544 [Actinomycetota bacterium]